MKSGIYRIYSTAGGHAPPLRTYLGRVVVTNGHTHVVEDRDGMLSQAIPDGAIDAQKERRWAALSESPYVDVVSEADLEPQEIQQPQIPPDETFDLVDDTLGTRRRVEAYGDDFFVDGRHLEPREAESLFNAVRLGELHLVPVQQ